MELAIDKRIQNALHPLTTEEFQTLERNCVKAGKIHDKIKLWGNTGIIIDGHNRFKIATKHNLPFETECIELATADDVMLWLLDNQFGRRNLSSVQLSMARAQRAKLYPDSSQEKIAASLGVTGRQLRTDAAVQGVVSEMPEELRERVASSSVIASQKDLAKLATLPEEVKQEIYSRLTEDKTLGLHEALPKEEKSRHGLSVGELEIVDQHFDSDVKRMIRIGSLKVSSREIAKIMAMPAIKRQFVFDVLAANESTTVAEAIELVKQPRKNSNPSIDIARAAERFEEQIAKAIASLDSFAAAKGKVDSELHIKLATDLKQVVAEAGGL